jgi:hypothetical protein
MVRSPGTEAVAEAIRAAMKSQNLSGVDLANRLERVRGSALPYDKGVWVSKRTSGKVHLVQPVKVIYGPTDELRDIAKALGVSVGSLVEVANGLEQVAADAHYRDTGEGAEEEGSETERNTDPYAIVSRNPMRFE